MKLVVVIPCLNEKETLPAVLRGIPTEIPNINQVEILVVDDGSTDGTAELAQSLGVHHVVRFKRNRGLVRAFETGLNTALKLGADIIVTTDGDNQYPSEDIPRLIEPIVREKADIVIGDRQTDTIQHFSPFKKFLQNMGSRSVSLVSGIDIPDAVSGFRAYSREAALNLNMVTNFSYTTEVVIQAAKKGLGIATVPIRTNPKTRESRLFGSIWEHVRKSGATIVRTYAMYQPLKVFFYIGALVFVAGLLLGLWSLFMAMTQSSVDGHIRFLLLSAVLIILGFQVFLIGLVADLVSINRKLLEDALYLAKRSELGPADDGARPNARLAATTSWGEDGNETPGVQLAREASIQGHS